ncbi:N-acetyltransferase, partial [Mesorhizobium sp. USDA-HM6]
MDQPAALLVSELPPDFPRWEELLALILRAFAYMDGVIDPPSSAHLLTAAKLKEKAKQETGFLALQGARIVGCVFVLERQDDFYIGKLAVEPDFQGQGIGRLLMRAAEEIAVS